MAACALAGEQHWWHTIHDRIITTAIYSYKNGLYTWSYRDGDILHLEGGAHSLDIRVSSLIKAVQVHGDAVKVRLVYGMARPVGYEWWVEGGPVEDAIESMEALDLEEREENPSGSFVFNLPIRTRGEEECT